MSRPDPTLGTMLGTGPLVWLHATNMRRMASLLEFSGRLNGQRPDCRVLLSYDPTHVAAPSTRRKMPAMVPLNVGSQAAARIFLSHWKPTIGLWSGGDISPNVINPAAELGTQLMLVDADDDVLMTSRLRLFRTRRARSLQRFSHIFTPSAAVREALIQQGIQPTRIEKSGPFLESSNPPYWPTSDVEMTSQELAGRPLWLAAHVRPKELDIVLRAQQSSARLSHRLLLVVSVSGDFEPSILQAQLNASGLRWAWRDDLDSIDEAIQVLVCDSAELSLWMRLAGLCFLGDSLLPDSKGHHPFDAAALGAGVLYGPRVSQHLDAYSRLAAAGAARMVQDAETLSNAVTHMISPDQIASIALNGWSAVTEGAPLMDRLLEIVQDMLDNKARPNAGA